MNTKNRLISTKGWAVQAVAALTCCISMSAHAADPLAGMSLKLDLALVNSAEDCDEPGDLAISTLSPVKPAMSAAVAAPAAAQPSTLQASEAIQLARLAPTAERGQTAVDQVSAAQTTVAAQAAKPVPAVKPLAASIDTSSRPTAWDIVPTDKTLNAALARWAAQAGWQLVWELPVDYAVEARTVVPGTFEEAVGTVARSMDSAEIPMKAIFYSGNKVLRIVAKGVE